jgi:hypothetical protein
MTITFLLYALFSITFTAYVSPSKNYNFSYGPNLVINGNITTPAITNYYYDYLGSSGGWKSKKLFV